MTEKQSLDHALILAFCKDSCRKAGCGEVCKRLVLKSKGA